MPHPCLSVLAVLACAIAPAAAQQLAQQPIDAGRPMAADAYIRIWSGGGALHVEGWDADSIAVSGRVAPGQFFLAGADDVAKLGLEGNLDVARGDLSVRVPHGATLWIRTVSADITVRGVTGSLDLYSVTGVIDVDGEPASFNAESMGGDLTLRLRSPVSRARTGTGGIVFEGAADDLTLTTVSGSIQAVTAPVRRARLTTVEGDIRFSGDVRSAGSLEIESHSGDLVLRVPPRVSAEFELSTFEGVIRRALGNASPAAGTASPAAGTARGRRLVRFGTGAGDADIVARSYSGSIEVRVTDRVANPQAR